MLVSFSGLIGSGKDTIADYLCTVHGFKRASFAASLKDVVAIVFSWDREMLDGITTSSRIWREQRDEWWSNRLGMEITPRWVLQHWGTEVCRDGFHKDIWAACLENKLRTATDNVVITDCRFKNELDAVKAAGGITIRVTRGPNPEWWDDAVAFNQGDHHIGWAMAKYRLQDLGIHPSEYSSVGLEYDYHINNDGTLEELYGKVNDLVQSHLAAK